MKNIYFDIRLSLAFNTLKSLCLPLFLTLSLLSPSYQAKMGNKPPSLLSPLLLPNFALFYNFFEILVVYLFTCLFTYLCVCLLVNMCVYLLTALIFYCLLFNHSLVYDMFFLGFFVM